MNADKNQRASAFHKTVTFTTTTTYKPMKVSILFFLLVSTTIFAQERHYFFNYFAIDELILGEWELEKTIMVDRDSVHYELLPTSKKSICIDEKSITVFRDSVKYWRHWKLKESFYYNLSYSEETNSGILSLHHEELRKKRKKQRTWASYIVKSCDFNQLVLYQIEHSPLSESDFSNYVYYIYKRKQTNKFGFGDFAGTWYYFGDKSLNLGEYKSNEPIRLSHTFDTLEISNLQMEGSLTFYFATMKNQITEEGQSNRYKKHLSLVIREDGTFYTVIDGVYLKAKPYKDFWIDFKNQLLYLLQDTISVYHFNFDEQGTLILTWDMERTKNLKKIER
jgi:hypothetical protein